MGSLLCMGAGGHADARVNFHLPNRVLVVHIRRRTHLVSNAMRAKSPERTDCEAAIVPLCLPNDISGAPPPLSHPTGIHAEYSLEHTDETAMTGTASYDTTKALTNAEMLSAYPEVRVLANRDITLQDGLDGIKSFFMYVLEWTHSIPDFINLNNDDKNLLMESSWCDLCILQFAANNQTASTIFQFGNGLPFSVQQIEDQTLRCLVDSVRNEILSWLRKMNIDLVEIAHIKALLLFNTGEPMV